MRCFLTLLLIAGLIAQLGCANLHPREWRWSDFGKNRQARNNQTPPPPPLASLPSPDAPPLSTNIPGPQANGLLAGKVVDAFDQGRSGAIVQVAATDAAPNERPIEAYANAQGYFTIQGLQPGRSYRLNARSQRGSAILQGSTLATPPNAVLLIKVSDDLLTSRPLPRPRYDSSPAHERANIAPRPNSSIPPIRPDLHDSWNTVPDRIDRERAAPEPFRPSFPHTHGPTGPDQREQREASTTDGPPLRPQFQTFENHLAQNGRDQILSLPRPSPFPVRQRFTLGEPSSARDLFNDLQRENHTPAGPGCDANRQQIKSFALEDLNGQLYHFRPADGQLYLIDFWGTWCTPCIRALPELVELKKRYGSSGLEIIGIAYEQGSPEEQRDRVNFIRHRQTVNYPMLLGDENRCPLKSKLDVQSFPTLLLVDGQGNIVWRGAGLSPDSRLTLEREIRQRL